jgi:EAL and modified HD-GYP domain-containing signal transduction protein
MLGLDSVRKWASVWALAGVSDGAANEMMNLAIIRARSCERIAESIVDAEAASEYFLLGLCSLLDAMLGRPMAEALEDLPVPDDVRAALLGEANAPRTVLDAVLEYERGRWDAAIAMLHKVGVPPHQLPIAYGDALTWARELTRTAAAA